MRRPISSEQTDHVLLREDLETAFDEAEALAAIEAMAEEAGDWRGTSRTPQRGVIATIPTFEHDTNPT